MVFYFSGTGNTEWLARQIAKATNDKIYRITDELKGSCTYHPEKDERIGFCFPIHGWQPPHIVREFVSKLKIETNGSCYIYALCTCGDTVGNAIKMFRNDLQRKQLHLDSAFSFIMPESYVCLPFMYTDTIEREQEKIATAAKSIKNISEFIINRSEKEILHKGKTPWLYSSVIGAYFNSRMITDKPFTVDAELCIKCGKCKLKCPTGNITMNEEGLPVWNHDNCTCCLACYHHCPNHAINYGKITRKRGQYYFNMRGEIEND